MIHLALAFDEAYVPWAATLIRSALDVHAPSSLRIHVLATATDGMRHLDRWVSGMGGSLEAHDISRHVEHLPSVDRFGPIVWAPFLLPELLPSQRRVLYLDADTFVVSSLEPLWSTPMDEPLGAVTNVVEPSLHPYVRSLGLEVTSFFNSGMLLMDIERMRAEDPIGDLSRFLAAAERLRWPDQDALNVIYAGRWKALHPRWNAMSSLWNWRDWAVDTYGARRVEEATRAPGILHFEGPSIAKPWHYLCTHPFTQLYRQALSRTPWAEAPLVDRTMGTRLVATLPRRWWMKGFVRLTRWRARLGRLAGH